MKPGHVRVRYRLTLDRTLGIVGVWIGGRFDVAVMGPNGPTAWASEVPSC